MNHATFKQVLALPASAPDAVLFYGQSEQQFGELWLPSDAPAEGAPLLILIHGGCWLNAFDIAHSRGMAMSLKLQGYAVWSLEYRRVGAAGGGFPGSFMDIGAGVDYVRQLHDYPLDLQRVVLIGHSAGGHLALWASSRAQLSASHRFYQAGALPVQGVIGLAAIIDLAAYAQGHSQCEKAAVKLMGGTPEQQPLRYQWVSPVNLPLASNALLIQGIDDSIVAFAQSEAAAARVDAEWLPIANAGHFDLIHPESDAWVSVLHAIKGVCKP